MHFGAENNTYVYFRYDGSKKVMVAFNKGSQTATLQAARFREMLANATSGVDIISGKAIALGTTITLPAKSVMIVEI